MFKYIYIKYINLRSYNSIMQKSVKLMWSISICLIVSFISSLITMKAVPVWYEHLHKPWFTPPNFLYSPLWTVLYIMMAVSLYLVWVRGSRSVYAKPAMFAFAIQLLLNFMWTVLFFGYRNPAYAFVDIILLWTAIIATANYSYNVSRPAAFLLIPYFLWVTFAAVLNYGIMILNP